jgi:thiol-disulfide isomerase/thioredoxin
LKSKSLLITLGGLLLGFLLGLGILWASGAFSGGGSAGAPRPAPKVGQPVPDFQLSSLDGRLVSLADFKGRPLVINFWATWCAPCKAEMPLIEQYYDRYAPELAVVGINSGEGRALAQKFVAENEIGFPILLDEGGGAAATYLVRGFPATFFIDASGVLQSAHIGQLHEENLTQYLKTIGIEP